MSFANNTNHTASKHVAPIKSLIHTHDKSGLKHSHLLALPPMNAFGGEIRVKPQTGQVSTIISSGGQLDYHVKPPGYVEKVKLELNLTIAAGASNPVQLDLYHCIDHIDIHTTEGNILETIYGDNIFFEKLHQTYEQHERQRRSENLASNYAPLSAIAAGTTKNFVLHIPCFIDASQPKLNTIRDRILFRFYFTSFGVASGAASDVTVNIADLVIETQQLAGELESLEIKRKSAFCQKFRILSPVRAASEQVAMVASSQYNIRLTSLNSLTAYLVFVIRPGSPTGATINSFQQVESFEILDENQSVFGLKTTNEMARDWLPQRGKFKGFIFTQKAGIYVVPFCLDVNAARGGNQTGFYAMNGNQFLRIYTPSTLVSGTYRVDVYGYEYNMLMINKGMLSIQK